MTGSVTLGLVFHGTGIDGFGTLALPSRTIDVAGTIDNYATARVVEVSGIAGSDRFGKRLVLAQPGSGRLALRRHAGRGATRRGERRRRPWPTR